MEDYESLAFRKYTYKPEMDKAIHTLEGIVKGIAIDNVINSKEINELTNWYDFYKIWANKHPFNELIPLIADTLKDNIIDKEEAKDIIWLCNKLTTPNQYYDVITSDIQRLQGILQGILSDNDITVDEIKGLDNWLEENEQLKNSYPYEEVYALVVSVLSDGIISDEEKQVLKLFFSEFVNLELSRNTSMANILTLKKELKISGICSVCPDLQMKNKLYCFTGISTRTTRKGFSNVINALGGTYNDRVTQDTDYLIIGADGNPCWAYSCYGRKVETAVSLRKKGLKIMIIHENDFWDTYQSYVDKLLLVENKNTL
jgi:NAD-dependent DNA ligase